VVKPAANVSGSPVQAGANYRRSELFGGEGSPSFAQGYLDPRHPRMLGVLHLDPVRRRAGAIGPIAALRHQALAAKLAGLAEQCSATIKMGIRIAASEIVPEGRFVASFKMLPLAVALFEASRSRSALSNAL
jgi:hypothetical protein